MPYRGNSFSEGIRLLKDYISYFINVILKHIQIVHINTFWEESILRDFIFAIYAKMTRKKCIVFFMMSQNEEILMMNNYKWLLKLYLKIQML